jgi:hypothetical protein
MHAELHRVADRRAEIEARDAHPRLRHQALVDQRHDPLAQPFARGDVARLDHQLREGLVRQVGVQREEEARAPLRRDRW